VNKLLLIGPPGSGKTRFVLEKILTAVREERGEEVLLVVPTASMVRHTLHTLARKNGSIPGNTVQTLTDFTVRLTPGIRTPSPALSAWLLKQIIQEVDIATSLTQNQTPGLITAIERTIKDLWAAGCNANQIKKFVNSQTQKSFAEVFQHYERRLSELDYVSPLKRFQSAATNIRNGDLGSLREIYFDGFFHLTIGEQELIQATLENSQKTIVTFVEKPDQCFKGLSIHRLKKIYRPYCTPTISRAVTPTHEIEEIAHRIVDGINTTEHSFADYGIVLRSPKIYEPIIRRVFERFGIPFRCRLSKPLLLHDNVRFVLSLLRAADKGFPAEETLDALRNPVCDAGKPTELDVFDFDIRRKLPGNGLSFLEQHATPYPTICKKLADLHQTVEWSQQTSLLTEWTERIDNFYENWSRKPEINDGLPILPCYDQILDWRSTAQMASAFRSSTEEAASILSISGRDRVSLNTYLNMLEFALQRTSVPVPDDRRNVVHVLPIYEARQWELPVVFVPGLVENQFPRPSKTNLFFGESDRENLQRNGIPLRSSRDYDDEETLLFQIARTRARQTLFFSYSQFDEQNKPLLRSFLLKGNDREHDRILNPISLCTPIPSYVVPTASNLDSTDLRKWITTKHASFSPTSLEDFIQCPYQYFSRHTLDLEERPPVPEERFDRKLEGNIVHRTLAEWSQDRSVPVLAILQDVFKSECQRNRIPTTVRTLASLYRMEEDLTQFSADEASACIFENVVHKHEADFQYVTTGYRGNKTCIRGRIDRYEAIEGKYAFVVDYKYSTDSSIRKLTDDEEGYVQGPLYLLGLEQELGLKPIGIQFLGLRNKITRVNKVLDGSLPTTSGAYTETLPERDFQNFLKQGLQRALNAIDKIHTGHIKVDPRDPDRCKHCNFRDLCRIRIES
tara:strand:+ start:11034 stop:13754 length:2721 start_codon:yes stop_codon:yes gene_type:complete